MFFNHDLVKDEGNFYHRDRLDSCCCVFAISCFGIEKAHSGVVCDITFRGITATKRNSPKLFTQCHKIKFS